MDLSRNGSYLLVVPRPPVFSTAREFRPMPCTAVWTFSPRDIKECFLEYPRWRNYCLQKESNYFNRTISRLNIIQILVNGRNRQRGKKWKSEYISYLVSGFTEKRPWGNFVYLKAFLSSSRPRHWCEPSSIPIILPQIMLGLPRSDGLPVAYEEKVC